MRLEFSVPFVYGLARPRFSKWGAYEPAKNKSAKQAIAVMYVQASRRKYGAVKKAHKPLPVTVRIETMRPLPKSKPKKIDEEHDTYKPDLDNVAKLVLDALNDVAYDDDSQVTILSVTKQPRTREAATQTTVIIEY